ncbi:MAG: hypothetical protein R3E93_06840 [Thiothrix sp.]
MALTLVIGVFVASNTLSEESGLLAVTIMGIWLANTKGWILKTSCLSRKS